MLGASVMGRGSTVSGAKWRGGWLVLGGITGRGMFPKFTAFYGKGSFMSGS